MSARNLVTCKIKVTRRSLSGKVMLPQTRNCFQRSRSFFSGSFAGAVGVGSAYCRSTRTSEKARNLASSGMEKDLRLSACASHVFCLLYSKSKYCIHIYGKRQWQTKRTRSMMQWLRMVQPRIRSGPRSFLGGGSGTGLATPSGNCKWESPQSLPTISSMMTASIAWVKETEGSNDMMQSSRQERTGAHDEAIRAWRARSFDRARTMKSKSRTAKEENTVRHKWVSLQAM